MVFYRTCTQIGFDPGHAMPCKKQAQRCASKVQAVSHADCIHAGFPVVCYAGVSATYLNTGSLTCPGSVADRERGRSTVGSSGERQGEALGGWHRLEAAYMRQRLGQQVMTESVHHVSSDCA